MSQEAQDSVGDAAFLSVLAQRINQRTFRQVHALSVERTNGCLVVRGRAAAFYTKQLAIAAVLEMINGHDALLPVVDIHVGIPSDDHDDSEQVDD